MTKASAPHTGSHNAEETTPVVEQRQGRVLQMLSSLDLPKQVMDLLVQLTAGNALLVGGDK